MIAIIAITIPISIIYANIFANIYPKNNDTMISIPMETGDETNQHLSIIMRNITNAKIIVNIPTIINLNKLIFYYC